MIYRISIYNDKKENILLVPIAKAEGGYGVEVIKKSILLEVCYDKAVIGEKVKECLDISANEPICNSKDIEKDFQNVTGYKSYAKFSKDRFLVTLFMDTENGFSVLPKKRYKDGSYRVDKDKCPEIKLSLLATNQEVGEAVMDRFEFLRNL